MILSTGLGRKEHSDAGNIQTFYGADTCPETAHTLLVFHAVLVAVLVAVLDWIWRSKQHISGIIDSFRLSQVQITSPEFDQQAPFRSASQNSLQQSQLGSLRRAI